MPIFKEIYMEDSYQINFLKAKLLTNTPVIIDIGANVGYAATCFFSCFPKARLISFEPLAVNFELLAKNQKQNPALSWVIMQQAISKERGIINIFYEKNRGLTP
ncbi:MAG: FkbM family methyltransferase, partial [Raineya sp.]